MIGKESYGHSYVDNIQLSAVFIPTWYGPIVIPGAAGEEENSGDGPAGTAQANIEQIIDQRVEAKLETIHRQYTTDLASLQAEIEQLRIQLNK
jgi:hypothetical protein